MMEIEAVLERAGLTEFERPASGPLPHINKWCQSGAQAGWAPDIDEVEVEERGRVIKIANDIFSSGSSGWRRRFGSSAARSR